MSSPQLERCTEFGEGPWAKSGTLGTIAFRKERLMGLETWGKKAVMGMGNDAPK